MHEGDDRGYLEEIVEGDRISLLLSNTGSHDVGRSCYGGEYI